MSNPDLQTALKTVLKKATSDAAFRAKALKDPAATLAEAGVELLAGQKIRFVEKIDEIVIALPPAGSSDAELGEDVLEKAAGGASTPNSTLKAVDCYATPGTAPMPPVSIAPRPTTVSWIL